MILPFKKACSAIGVLRTCPSISPYLKLLIAGMGGLKLCFKYDGIYLVHSTIVQGMWSILRPG